MPKLTDSRDKTLWAEALKYLDEGKLPPDKIGKDMLYVTPLLDWKNVPAGYEASLSDRIVVTLGPYQIAVGWMGWIAKISLTVETGDEVPNLEPIQTIVLTQIKLEIAKILAEGLARTWVKGMNGRL